jgi:hypothetical protein
MPRRLTRAEQETVITRCADENEWLVYTCDPAVRRRLEKFTSAHGFSLTIVDEWGVEARLPVSCVRFMSPIVISAQERANRSARAGRLAAANKAKRSEVGQEACERAAG